MTTQKSVIPKLRKMGSYTVPIPYDGGVQSHYCLQMRLNIIRDNDVITFVKISYSLAHP